ncbi:MAG TPA: VOC family protein [Ktedonobacteraceae bacterium]|jgi:catechol 2,3-dioxygenase-like lactoylglutathione lyase family enzyme|nr:VOC family protein [Ktedonobacteraceae bacterium]
MTSIYQRQGVHLPRLQHASLPIKAGTQDNVRAFYGKLLGLQEKPATPTLRAKGIIWFAVGDGEMEIHFIPDTYLAHPEEGRHICLEVDDLETYRQHVSEAGYPIIEADPIPHRPRFFTRDPNNNRIEFTTIEGNYLEEL